MQRAQAMRLLRGARQGRVVLCGQRQRQSGSGLTHARPFSFWPSSKAAAAPTSTDSVYIPSDAVPTPEAAASLLPSASSSTDVVSSASASAASLTPDIASTATDIIQTTLPLTTLTSTNPYLPPGLYLTLLDHISSSSLPSLPSFLTPLLPFLPFSTASTPLAVTTTPLTAIILTALLARLAIAPLTILSQQELAKTAPIASDLAALNALMRAAHARGDTAEILRLRGEVLGLQARAGAKPMRSLGALGGQMVVSVSQFMGVQAVCGAAAAAAAAASESASATASAATATAAAPVPGLEASASALAGWVGDSGVEWVGSLVGVAPNGLAAVACGLVFVQAKLGQREQPPNSPMAPMMKWFPVVMPGLTYLGITALQLPSALVVSMATFSAVHSVQSLIMQIPAVRRALGLLPLGTAISPAATATVAQAGGEGQAQKRRK